MLRTLSVDLLTCLCLVVVNQPIVVPYAIPVLPNSRVDIESPPEQVLHSDEIGVTTVHHSFLRIFHFMWLPWRVCEGRQDENRRREPTLKQGDSDRLFPCRLEHRGLRSLGRPKPNESLTTGKKDKKIALNDERTSIMRYKKS